MKIMNFAVACALLALTSGSASAWNFYGINSEDIQNSVPAAPAPKADADTLRAEAAADPERFVDERTPEEVSLAFGLTANDEAQTSGFPAARYMINNELAKLATVQARVDLGEQRLTVTSPEGTKTFKISSGLAPEHGTPGSGRCFAPDFIEEMHYSSLYNKAPMPNSVFFNGNIAIHGTNAEQLLGQPASHGCIRLSKADAKTFYGIVKANGKSNTSICVLGRTPVK